MSFSISHPSALLVLGRSVKSAKAEVWWRHEVTISLFFLDHPHHLNVRGMLVLLLLFCFVCLFVFFFLLHNKLPPPPPTEWLGNSKHLLSHNSQGSGTRKWFIWVVGLTSCTQCYLWLQSSECLIGGWKICFQVLISGHWQEAVALHYSICSQHVNWLSGE